MRILALNLVATGALVTSLFLGSDASAGTRDACAVALSSVVAISTDPSATSSPYPVATNLPSQRRIILASVATETISVPVSASDWRFRVLTVLRLSAPPTDVQLAEGGTVLYIRTESSIDAFDLTRGGAILSLSRESQLALGASSRVISKAPPEDDASTSLESSAARTACDVSILRAYQAALDDRACRTLNEEDRHRKRQPSQCAGLEAMRWKFYTFGPEPELYAPILEFAPHDITTSSLNVWNALDFDALSKMERDQGSLFGRKELIPETIREYGQLPAQERTCHIYYHTDRTPVGTYLFEYWLYYPYDSGAFEDHLHDSEHLFVEVDPLGGSVRQVIGAAHGPWTTNNIYQAFRPNSPPVTLPLYAIVEFRKHATAPDINADGLFVPGIDTNQYLDRAKVWGVRDTIGATDVNLRGYDASMGLRRRTSEMHADKELLRRFSADFLPMLPEHRDCTIAPLPETTPYFDYFSKGCAAPRADCAMAWIRRNEDFEDPRRILKGGVFPPKLLRAGVSLHPGPRETETTTGNALIATTYLGVGIELSSAFFGKLALPGRLTVDAFFRDTPKLLSTENPDPNAFDTIREGKRIRFAGVAVHYERALTNLVGSYTGLSWLTDLRSEGDAGIQSAWLDAGLKAEVAVGRLYRADASLGLTFHNFYGLDFDLRLGLGVRLPPWPHFGVR
jgi:hypothetical protein